MLNPIRVLPFSILLGVTAGLLGPGTAPAQTGTVLSHQKQSDTVGTFTAPLHDLDEFGSASAGLGNLDGAGPSVVAVAVGAPFDDDGGTSRGAVHVLFLDAAGKVLSQQKISDTSGNFAGTLGDGDEFGSAVAYLGDLDGSGPSVAAVAVGAPGDDDGGVNRGAVYVLFLAGNRNVLTYQKISNTAGGFAATLDNIDEFGTSAAGLGDLDGAGPAVAALAVGAVGDDDGGQDRGAAYILFLSGSGAVLSHQKIGNAQGGFAGALDNLDEFGSSLAGLGDLDGAGPSVRALAVGASLDDDGGGNRGAIYVCFLDTAGKVLSNQKISSTQGGLAASLDDFDELGGSLVDLGDLDGAAPGVKSLAVGATGDDDGGGNRGAVYVIQLSAAGTAVSFQKISSTQGNFSAPLHIADSFGSATGFLGDLDGPGPSGCALVVGADGDDDGGTDRGAVYVIFLAGSTPAKVPDFPAGHPGGMLGPAWPNPFRGRTSFPYQLARAAEVQLEIRDAGGRLVRRLQARPATLGEGKLEWDGRDDFGHPLPSGTYFCRTTLDGRVMPESRKATLLR